MKKLLYMMITIVAMGAILQGCGSENENTTTTPQPTVPSENNVTENNATESNTTGNETINDETTEDVITKEMAYEGVNNYCHSEYDWSIAEENPSIMYVEMGEETETEYQVVFRSYTGSFMYFFVDKTNGTTRMVEHVPTLDIENEVGTFDLHEYLE